MATNLQYARKVVAFKWRNYVTGNSVHITYHLVYNNGNYWLRINADKK
jgi:hypothetical protein